MFGQGLRQLQSVLNRKADMIQREFNAVGTQVQALSQKINNTPQAERAPLISEREDLYARQQNFGDEVNRWRDRARDALRQSSDETTRLYLEELLTTRDDMVRPAVDYMLLLLNSSENELAALSQSQLHAIAAETPASRYIERARTAHELRGADPAPRRLAAFEFANRTGVAQNDQALAELEAVLNDPDPLVSEIMTQTIIQMHRFRALRLGDLDVAQSSTVYLTQLTHPTVVAVLIEIATTARTGFTQQATGIVEANNALVRETALVRLKQWDTPEAQAAVQASERAQARRLA